MSFLNRKKPEIAPVSVAGFSHVKRFWSNADNLVTARILPGEYYVTIQDEVVATVLGSCISACIRDKKLGIGGMNHFMLPDSHGAAGDRSTSAEARYGGFAMEQLINDILKNGGRRRNLEVKIVGGGRIMQKMDDVGRKNIAFVREYLAAEGLAIVAEDVGDICPRKVLYFPVSGKLRVKKLESLHGTDIVAQEDRYHHQIDDKPIGNDVELF